MAGGHLFDEKRSPFGVALTPIQDTSALLEGLWKSGSMQDLRKVAIAMLSGGMVG